MKAVVFNDFCSLGNCALKVNISVLMQNGIEIIPIATKFFSAHMGYSNYLSFENKNFKEIVLNILENEKNIDLVYIGFVDSKEQSEIIKYFLKKSNPNKIILDPILGDNGKKYLGVNDEQVQIYREFIKFSDIVTPNLTEAMLLSDYNKEFINIEREDVLKMAKNLQNIGSKEVIIKGLNEGESLITLYFDGNFTWNKIKKVEMKICGTGDAFSSLISVCAVKDKNLKDSISKIQDLLYYTICNKELSDGLNEINTEFLKLDYN